MLLILCETSNCNGEIINMYAIGNFTEILEHKTRDCVLTKATNKFRQIKGLSLVIPFVHS